MLPDLTRDLSCPTLYILISPGNEDFNATIGFYVNGIIVYRCVRFLRQNVNILDHKDRPPPLHCPNNRDAKLNNFKMSSF